MTPLLEVEGLRVTAGSTTLVRGVDLSIEAGESVALVGESGSGKTSTALAAIGYTRPGTTFTATTMRFGGHDLLTADARTLRRLRGGRIGFVPQNPVTSLNPALRIESQFADLLAVHADRPQAKAADVGALLESVALPGDRAFRRRYPHQLSGGQQQRVLIAMALACGPDLIVLDEPTTGLDVTTQERITTLIDDMRRELGVALLYVSHDLAVISKIADRVLVMYGGQVIEDARHEQLFGEPRHPYTRLLIGAVPRIDAGRRVPTGIPGVAIGTRWNGQGCIFADRCPHHLATCDTEQTLDPFTAEHLVRCIRAGRLTASVEAEATERERKLAIGEPILRVEGLTARYPGAAQPAIGQLDLRIHRGESVAVVGESGSGKSTLARCIAGLHRDWSGTLQFDGEQLAQRAQQRTRDQRTRIQIVFQNPDRSLNPRHSVGQLLMRPCRQLLGLDAAAARRRAHELLAEVRLPAHYFERKPRALSGGERQRVAIARALAAQPDLLVCDEITSALDVSIQASLLELLLRLQEAHSLSMLFISHDLGVVRSLADWVVVMRHGEVCESRSVEDLFAAPRSDYTSELLAASPQLAGAA
jgi:peptide/nickel transport system ATP-binding protein